VKKKVYTLPKHLDEKKVARLHLDKPGQAHEAEPEAGGVHRGVGGWAPQD
jgi:hypothetical protein